MTLQERDKHVLWHAYTQHKTERPPIAITKAKDALLWDENGKQYIDAISSWWVNPYGHANEVLAQVAYKQMTRLEHILFGGFTHQPAIELAETLLKILPNNQKKVFFSDNGSTAVEVAIKMSLQYHVNLGDKRSCLIAFENAFHGDTFAAMAVSGISLYTEAFKDELIPVIRIPVPIEGKEQESLNALQEVLIKYRPAAFIFEPLVQGAAGMVIYSPKILDTLISECKQHGVLTIADEVMTGFGRTGKNFACEYLQTQPDIICLSKALTGGTIPLAVTTTTQNIFDAFYDDDINKALFHGHTFMANPTACAIALQSISLLTSLQMQKNIKRINKNHSIFSEKLKKYSIIKNIRYLGVILAFDFDTTKHETYYGTLRNMLYHFFIENGVIIRPVGQTVYILPPYITTDKQLHKIYKTIEMAIEMVNNSHII